MKKLYAILFICLMIAPFYGTHTLLNIKKGQIRRSVKRQIIAGIDREELVLLAFSKAEAKSELRWEHSREFEFHNEMYDVVETVEKADSLFFWCWWDQEETVLNKKLLILVENTFEKNPYTRDQRQRVVNFYKSLFSQEDDEGRTMIFPQGSELSAIWVCNYHAPDYAPGHPPPEVV